MRKAIDQFHKQCLKYFIEQKSMKYIHDYYSHVIVNTIMTINECQY